MLNNVTLVGRAGAGPEIRHFESGKVKGTVNIAVTRATKEKEADWFPIEAWGKQAEILGEFVKKGHKFGVVGELKNEEWKDQNSGEKRRKTIISAQRIILMQEKEKDGTPPAESAVNSSAGRAERASANPFDAPRQPIEDLDSIFAADDDIPF